MAKLTFEGLDACMLSMKEVADLPDDTANAMLQAGGEIVAAAQRRNIMSALQQRTGNLAKSVTVTPKMKTRNGTERFITVYPRGKHHTYNHQGTDKIATNNEVAFVNEYGAKKRGISPTGMIRKANEESAGAAVDAQYQVYDAWLKTKGM